MPSARKPDPLKNCQQCGSAMARKRFGGVLEDLSVFGRRKFCGRECMAASMEGRIKVLNEKNSRRQATKQRGPTCCECGDGEGLSAHHRNGDPLDNSPTNIATLCQSCHMKGHWRIWKQTARQETACLYCESRSRKLSMCQKHYQRWRKYGDPHVTKRGVGGIARGVRAHTDV